MWLDTFMPRQCKLCGCRLAEDEQTLCLACSRKLPLTDDYLSPYDNNTARLLWGRMPVERATALTYYYPESFCALLMYKLKYGSQPDIGEWLGAYMANSFMPYALFDDIDIIVPLPIHKRRERERGYNQSHEIARGIGDISNIEVCNNIVERSRYTMSQTKLTHADRTKNVVNAFTLLRPDAIEGKHVLLVDDIITTGATIAACANVLAEAEDVKISVMTVGRTHNL